MDLTRLCGNTAFRLIHRGEKLGDPGRRHGAMTPSWRHCVNV